MPYPPSPATLLRFAPPALARPLAIACAAVAIALSASPALADEFIDRVNGFLADIRPDRRSDPIILGALAAMESPPPELGRPLDAALLPPSAAAWGAAEAWATAAPQVAALEALHRVVEDAGGRRRMAFGQPYGLDALGASPEQIAMGEAGLYTDLGDPPLLSAARHLYLPRFDDLGCLVQVEATRRLNAGDPGGALVVLGDWAHFGRQIADREFHEEKLWAMRAIFMALVRIRDVVYTDSRAERLLTVEQLHATIERLKDDREGIPTERMQFPRADFVGVEQLVATVMEPRGMVRSEVFATTMARLASTRRPLRIFGEAARWETVAQRHLDWFMSQDVLAALRNDYEFRWPRSRFDPLLAQPFVVERYTSNPELRDAVAVVTRSLPDMRDLFTQRLLVLVELVGTRNALGLVGFHAANHAYPLDLSAIRPRFVTDLGGDPFNPGEAGSRPPLNFFVPVRDTKDRFSDRQTVPPHEISVLTTEAPNVSIELRDDQFVLYSVGADGSRQWAEEAQNSPDAPPGRDYLLWPPVLSIVRESLMQSGRLR